MRYFRNVIYACLLLILAPWLFVQSMRSGKYRESWLVKMCGRTPLRGSNAPCIWIHAVSVGEVNVAATLLPRLQARFPDHEFVVTTTTKTGYDLATKTFSGCLVSYAPLDFSWAIRCALSRIRPSLLILIELELWPNLIELVSDRRIPIAIVNGRLSQKSYRGYRLLRPLIAGSLRRVDRIVVQDSTYAQRFVDLGANQERVVVSGSVKYDGARSERDNPETRRLAGLIELQVGDRVLMAGSTQDPEEQMIIDLFRQLAPTHPGLRCIIVPRHPERFEQVAGILKASGLPWVRRTELPELTTSIDRDAIILVDTVGELGAWWGIADIAFVGGSFGNRGGQNMIEPAAYGAAVCFGPHTSNFRDIVASLTAANAAAVVHDQEELVDFAGQQLAESPPSQMGINARQFVASQRGAAQKTVDLLDQLVKHSSGDGERLSA